MTYAFSVPAGSVSLFSIYSFSVVCSLADPAGGANRCSAVRGWLHLKLVLNLRQVDGDVVAHTLLPPVLVVEEDVLAHVLLHRSVCRRRLSPRFLAVRLLEPRLELLLENPLLLFQLYGRHVLLVRALLVVECEKQGLQIKFREVVLATEQWHRRVLVLLLNWDGLFWINYFLVPGCRHVLE